MCSSSKAKLVAFEAALMWFSQSLRSIVLTEHEVRISVDSRPLVGALLSGQQRKKDAGSKHVWQLTQPVFQVDGCHLTVLWIHGHCGLYGKEATDHATREVA